MAAQPRRWTFWGAGAALVAVLIYFSSSLRGGELAIDPSRVAEVQRGPMVRSVVATGKIEPITKIEVKSKANGIIEVLGVDVGGQVRKGDLLAELDKDNLTARLREAEANAEASMASLAAARAQLEKNTIEAEGPEVDFARRSHERARQLSEQQLLPQSELDNTLNALEVAINRRRAAQAQLPVSRARVTESEAQVAQAKANVRRVQEELGYATLRAPIKGTVLTRDVEIGSPVSSILNMGAMATLVMTIGDIGQVFVRGKVDEADIGRVQLGQPARISVETYKDRKFEGKVTQISPIGVEKDNVTTFEVEVSIENAANVLKANMTANAEIVLEEQLDTLIVPEAAVTYDANRDAFVELLDASAEGGRRKTPVKLGISSGTKTQVLEGLEAGDKVVLPL
jgi:HlyD family secretion protein